MTSPRGSGLVLLMRRNWSRCMSTESVTNAVTGTGRSCRCALASARARCWPSTIQPGFGLRPAGSGISSVPLQAASSWSLTVWCRGWTVNRTVDGSAMMIGLGKMTLVAVEVVDDLLDVLADLGTLVADEVAGLVAADPGDVGDLQDLRGGQAEDVERGAVRLVQAQRSLASIGLRARAVTYSPCWRW